MNGNLFSTDDRDSELIEIVGLISKMAHHKAQPRHPINAPSISFGSLISENRLKMRRRTNGKAPSRTQPKLRRTVTKGLSFSGSDWGSPSISPSSSLQATPTSSWRSRDSVSAFGEITHLLSPRIHAALRCDWAFAQAMVDRSAR